MDFLNITNQLFKLGKQKEIEQYLNKYQFQFSRDQYSEDALSNKSTQPPALSIRESTITFKTDY